VLWVSVQQQQQQKGEFYFILQSLQEKKEKNTNFGIESKSLQLSCVSLVSLSFAALAPSNFFFFLFLPLLLFSIIWETRFFDVSGTPGAQIFTRSLFDLHKKNSE